MVRWQDGQRIRRRRSGRIDGDGTKAGTGHVWAGKVYFKGQATGGGEIVVGELESGIERQIGSYLGT